MTTHPLGVALCITELDVGGAERCCAELAARLDRSRFAPIVYALSAAPVDRQRSVVPLLEQAEVPVVFLGGRGARDGWRVARQLRRQLENQRPAAVQSFLFHANVVARFALPRHDPPLLVCGIRVAERAARWHLTLDRLTSRRVNGYACVSQQVADFSRDVAGLSAERLHVIPNGVDVQAIAAAPPADLTPFGVVQGRRVMVAVGRLEHQKGLDRLLPLAERWRRGELHDWDLLIVGDGPQRGELSERFVAAGAENRVHFAGWRADVPAILQACNLLVLPSRWEGMPNVVLEAMAAGLPVAAADAEGVREILGPLAAGQVAANRDGQAMTDLIGQLAGASGTRAQLGAANRARAAEEFSLDAMARRYEALWERLLRERTRGRQTTRPKPANSPRD